VAAGDCCGSKHIPESVSESDMDISPEEYQRRGEYLEALKTMKKTAYVEIARILRKHNIQISENRSGIFFDMAKLPQVVFDELVQLRGFIDNNNKELQQRESSLEEARHALEA
jgi:hypothetical protein